MYKKLSTLIITALLICNVGNAKIFRVGYNGLPLSGVDFTDLQPAQDAASAGDTIQIYTSSATNGNINKKLVIIGYGYNFDANTNLQAIGTDAPSSANIGLYAGSDGSIISGISGNFTIGDGNSTGTPVSNIIIQRCSGTFYLFNYVSSGAISNVNIISCVMQYLQFYYSGASANPVTNLKMYNCIIGGINFVGATSGTTATIENCVSASLPGYGALTFALNDAGVLVKNCILSTSNSVNNINTVYESNFFGEAQPAVLPAGSNNRWSQDWAVIFNRLGGTDAAGYYSDPTFDEDYYVLKAGSPAINGGLNAANNPTNDGIYGGEAAYIYKLSGVPAVPAIYKLTAPGSAATSNPYNITISVRSNN